MGTRGLIGFIIAAQRHASYNHFDSYPSGLGADIVKFILSLSDEEIDKMVKVVSDLKWVDGDAEPSAEIQEHYAKAGFSDLSVGRQSTADWYCLLRKVQGAAILPAIQSGELQHVIESKDFLGDGLFCEWAYFIDFESKFLETWASGRKVDQVTFDALTSEGVKGYIARFEGE